MSGPEADIRKARTSERTRAILIDIGKHLVLERGVSSGLGHIRLQDVLRYAHMSTGAAYRIWGNQDDFHEELAAAVITWRVSASTASTREEVFVDGAPPTLDDLIRLGAHRHIATFLPEHRQSAASKVFAIALAMSTSGRFSG